MNEGAWGRRGVLSGSMAAVLARAAPGGVEPGDARPVANAGDHAQFRAAFLDWLDAARDRILLPVSAQITSPAKTTVHLRGVHPAIAISLQDHGHFASWVEYDGMCWDSWLWLDVIERRVAGGWVNDSLIEEYRVVHPTMELLWTADIFEPLLTWINGDLSRATHIALWGEVDRCTEAYLVRNGVRLRTGKVIDAEDVTHLLPAHGHIT